MELQGSLCCSNWPKNENPSHIILQRYGRRKFRYWDAAFVLRPLSYYWKREIASTRPAKQNLRLKLQEGFANACIWLRILLTIPATVASTERSFSKLKLTKNYLRATSGQSRVVYLARLNTESELAQDVAYDVIIKTFTEKTTWKVFLKQSWHLHQFLKL